jgi:hypothetical protein
MAPVEYASMSDAALRQLDISMNGLDHQASQELRRRALAELTGAGRRDPRALLRELERRKNGPDLRSPAEKVIATYAMCRHTRDPREAMLALHAMRISQGW